MERALIDQRLHFDSSVMNNFTRTILVSILLICTIYNMNHFSQTVVFFSLSFLVLLLLMLVHKLVSVTTIKKLKTLLNFIYFKKVVTIH